jgi:hypothetical protein
MAKKEASNPRIKKFPCTKSLKCPLTNDELLVAGEGRTFYLERKNYEL